MKILDKKYIPITVSLVLAFLFSSTAVAIFVNREQPLYFWDLNGYYSMWRDLSTYVITNPLWAIVELAGSVVISDYNRSSIALPALFRLWFLPDRLAYILGVALFYIPATAFIFTALLSIITGKKELVWKVLFFILPLTFVNFWVPTLRGFPDIAGITFLLGALLYFSGLDLSKKLPLKNLLILGFLLWTPFLMRRWLAYSVVSLYVSLPILTYYLHRSKELSFRENLNSIVKNFLVIGGSSVLLALFFQPILIFKILTTSYSEIYSAYQFHLSKSFHDTVYGIGLYVLPFLLLGLWAGIRSSNKNIRGWVFFSLFNLGFSFFLFTRTQSPGMQHIMPFALWGMIISTLGLSYLLDKMTSSLSSWLGVIVNCLFFVFVFLSTFFPNPLFQNTTLNKVLPNKTFPLHTDYFKGYDALRQNLMALPEIGDQEIAMFSSSFTINSDLIKTVLLDLDSKTGDWIFATPDVDLRDKINLEIFTPRYAIVGDPPQHHLRVTDQQVVLYPAELILNGKGIGGNYKRISEAFQLGENANAYIYERIQDPTLEQLEEYVEHFFISYPEWREIYTRAMLQETIDQFNLKK